MLKRYVQAALHHANYEILADDGSFYGAIPICNGVYANAPTLEMCREQLEEVLEEWILFRVSLYRTKINFLKNKEKNLKISEGSDIFALVIL